MAASRGTERLIELSGPGVILVRMTGMTIDLRDLPRLTPFEDGLLRRLFFFESAGATLAPALRVVKSELRARDQRSTVREPEEAVTRIPSYA
jgi:hypothetical protein